jgi:LPXTG-motif cell wall-anchored protein
MSSRIAAIFTAILFGVACAALAQRADPNTGGPTKNTLRLTVAEPAEGAVIVGSVVRVVVAYNHDPFTGQGTSFGEPNFPQPRFDVYLDDQLKTTLKGTEANVANLVNVSPGSHKITVVALNVSGEIIDRKEVEITTSEAAAAAAPAPPAENVPQAAPAPAPAPAYEPPAAPVEKPTTLPATASHSPAIALAGLALLAGGLLIARKTR